MSPASAGVTSPLTRRVTGEHTGQAARLALQLELCLPRLLSSPAPEGSFDGLRAFSRNPGRRARPTSLLPFPLQRAEPSIRRSRGPIMAQPMSDATNEPLGKVDEIRLSRTTVRVPREKRQELAQRLEAGAMRMSGLEPPQSCKGGGVKSAEWRKWINLGGLRVSIPSDELHAEPDRLRRGPG